MGECPETGCLVVVQDEIRGARIGFVSGSKDNEIEITFEDSTNDSRWTPSLFSGDKEWFGERSPKICRESSHILIKVSRFHDDKVHCELFLGSRSSYRQRMRCLSFSKQSIAFSNICDCDAFQDNFKTLFGVPGLSFRGGVFGTKLIKKGSKFSIEAGDRFRPEHQSDDVYVVVGISISRISRNTVIRVLVVKEGELDLREVDLKMVEEAWDTPDRVLEATCKSVQEAIEGRHVAKIVAHGKGPLNPFALDAMKGSRSRKAAQVFLLHF